MSASKSHLEEYGWNAVPCNRSTVPTAESAQTKAVEIDFEREWPDTEVVRKAKEYIKAQLPDATYRHSIRVYYYGRTITTQHFPSWLTSSSSSSSSSSPHSHSQSSFLETWALTCLFHDLATTTTNRTSTHLSFEYQGGYLALELLLKFGAPKEQAESVAEAIIRHQDPVTDGMITRMGMLVQLATEFDNMGWQPHLISPSVITQVVSRYPRSKWSSCFAGTVRAEIAEKPWAHSTAIPGFAEAVEGNKLMEPYD